MTKVRVVCCKYLGLNLAYGCIVSGFGKLLHRFGHAADEEILAQKRFKVAAQGTDHVPIAGFKRLEPERIVNGADELRERHRGHINK